MLKKINGISYKDAKSTLEESRVFFALKKTDGRVLYQAENFVLLLSVKLVSKMFKYPLYEKTSIQALDYILQTDAFIDQLQKQSKRHTQGSKYVETLQHYQELYRKNEEKPIDFRKDNKRIFAASIAKVYWEEIEETLEYIWDYFVYAKTKNTKGVASFLKDSNRHNFFMNIWTIDSDVDLFLAYITVFSHEERKLITKEKLEIIQENLSKVWKKDFHYISYTKIDIEFFNILEDFFYYIEKTLTKISHSFHNKKIYNEIPYFRLSEKEVFRILPTYIEVLESRCKRIPENIQKMTREKEKLLIRLIKLNIKKSIEEYSLFSLLATPNPEETSCKDLLRYYRERSECCKHYLLEGDKNIVRNHNLYIDFLHNEL